MNMDQESWITDMEGQHSGLLLLQELQRQEVKTRGVANRAKSNTEVAQERVRLIQSVEVQGKTAYTSGQHSQGVAHGQLVCKRLGHRRCKKPWDGKGCRGAPDSSKSLH